MEKNTIIIKKKCYKKRPIYILIFKYLFTDLVQKKNKALRMNKCSGYTRLFTLVLRVEYGLNIYDRGSGF